MPSLENKDKVIRELIQRAEKLKASQRDWEKNWKDKLGPLKGVPLPKMKQEGGRV